MDRRHLVLAIAVAATIADDKGEQGPVYAFEGSQNVTLETVQLEGHESRTWVVTSEMVLPPEAEGKAYDSMLSVLAYVTGSEGRQRVSLVVYDCDGGGIIAQAVVADEPGGGSWIEGQVDVPDFLRDCPVGECVRTVCLDVTNDTATSAEVGLELEAWVTSEAFGDDEANMAVSIDLTIEEIDA